MSSRKFFNHIVSDPEFWAILIFNLFILYGYYTDTVSVKAVIILYYLQSVLIGLQTVVRMASSGRAMHPKTEFLARYGTAMFFSLHYGLFHLVYFVFITIMMFNIKESIDWRLIWGAALFIFFNTVVSVVSDIKRDRESGKPPASIMVQPYIRILPMHLFIIIGFNAKDEEILSAFLIFIVLKTMADLIMHIVVNKTYKARRPRAREGWI